MKLSTVCLLFGFFLALSACDDDSESGTKSIEGVWREEAYVEDYDWISRLEYNFREDGTVQILRIEVNKDSGEILGYRHKSTGNYVVSGNKLSFYNLTVYSNDDAKTTYSELEDLIQYGQDVSYDVTFEIGKGSKEVTFFFPPCDDSGICAYSQIVMKAV